MFRARKWIGKPRVECARFHSNENVVGGLKIRVSVVQFLPWAPFFARAPREVQNPPVEGLEAQNPPAGSPSLAAACAAFGVSAQAGAGRSYQKSSVALFFR